MNGDFFNHKSAEQIIESSMLEGLDDMKHKSVSMHENKEMKKVFFFFF